MIRITPRRSSTALRISTTGRAGRFLLALVLAGLLLALLAPATASAEREDDSPMFQRLAMHYLSLVKRDKEPYEDGLHFGAFAGWTNRLFFREFFLANDELNLHGGGFFQIEGFRIEGYGYWADPFDRTDFSRPAYWEINASYLFDIDNNLIQVGIRRNSFADADAELGLPHHIDEVFAKLIAVPSEIQGGGNVNLMYTLQVVQRISGGEDGTLITVGFQTLSTNAWIIGDVLSLSGNITWNQRYLQPYGRFSSYMFTAKIIKDVSNIDDPGRGPIWIEIFGAWHGAILDHLEDEATVVITLWAVF